MRRLGQKVPIHAWVAGSAWASRLVIAITQLFSIPLLIRYLGAEEYSLFVVAMSLQGWWLLTDIGIANSLQNYISERRALEQGYSDLLVNAAAIMVSITVVFVSLLLAFREELAMAILPNVPSMATNGAGLMVCTGTLFLLLTVGNVAYKILYAEQKGYWANLLPALGAIVGFLGLLILDRLDVDNRLLWATVLLNAPSALIASFAFVALTAKALRISDGMINRQTIFQLLKRGRNFAIFAVMAALTLQIDYIVIGKLMTAYDVLLYNVSTKMLGFASFLYLAIIQSLWPVCAEAFARKEWEKATTLFRRALLFGAIILLMASVFLWCFKSKFLELLAPQQNLNIPPIFWILLTTYALIRVWSDGYAMLLQSMSRMKIFLYYVPLQAFICAVAQLTFGSFWGLNGILLGLITSFLLTSVWLLPWEYRKARAS